MRRPGLITVLRFHLARFGRRLWIVGAELVAWWEGVKMYCSRQEYVFGGRSLRAGTPVNRWEGLEIWIADGASPSARVDALLREAYRRARPRVAR